MGKGDKKSEKGKRWRKSFGKSRPRHGGKKKGKPASSAIRRAGAPGPPTLPTSRSRPPR